MTRQKAMSVVSMAFLLLASLPVAANATDLAHTFMASHDLKQMQDPNMFNVMSWGMGIMLWLARKYKLSMVAATTASHAPAQLALLLGQI